MRLIAPLLLLCLSLFGLAVHAEPVSDLYQVREPVASQQPEERTQALNRALETLLLRLTGDRKAAQNPALETVRKDPQELISQYGYEGQMLVVDFDPVTTERTLRQAGIPMWGANRPSILAWWLNRGNEGASLVGDGQDAAASLYQAAQNRGLPLRLPLADLDEQLLATPEQLTSAQPGALTQASERYAADALLAVDAAEADGKWQAQWRLWLGDSREQGTVEAADNAALADAVLLAVSERLAPRFVAAPGAGEEIELEVQGANLARYAELSRMLEPFGARLVSVEGDRLAFRVNASAEQLRAQLALIGLRELPVGETPAGAVQPAGQAGSPAPQLVPRSNLLRFHW
ncbi:DUF2066 domain-containing protein [Metapseudomonas boanensis]|uniref:DUF2066 domain-containing protein n=1 Tax=Metapseudomonas boanensis TaxID=2822138 RepID=A0ABS5XIW2_9GAMM|nr:DUF2066 domain-containing protein [Pseudomonas boanensis]MBT8767617.1 DUF2066 domain-containing protein [Pseudomonas boanensis]